MWDLGIKLTSSGEHLYPPTHLMGRLPKCMIMKNKCRSEGGEGAVTTIHKCSSINQTGRGDGKGTFVKKRMKSELSL